MHDIHNMWQIIDQSSVFAYNDHFKKVVKVERRTLMTLTGSLKDDDKDASMSLIRSWVDDSCFLRLWCLQILPPV